MVTEVTEKRIITEKEARAEFDGRWVLIDERDFSQLQSTGYLVAYGDGTPEDRDALRSMNFKRYNGKAFLLKGYVPKDDVYVCGTVD